MSKQIIATLCLALTMSISTALAKDHLKNGAILDVSVDKSLPRETLVLSFEGGAGALSRDLQGTASILRRAMEEGPASVTGEQYRRDLYLLNTSISFDRNARSTFIVVKAPQEHLQKALEITRSLIVNPKLDEETIKSATQQVLSNAVAIFDDMRTAIYYFGFRDAFGYHPDTFDGTPSVRSVKLATTVSVKEAHKVVFDFSKLNVYAVGPSSSSAIKEVVSKTFADNLNVKHIPLNRARIDVSKLAFDKFKVSFINKAGATDNQLLYVFPENLRPDTQERAVAMLAHQILGGGMTGQLAEVLRTQRGLTYFAGAKLDAYNPYWFIWTFGGLPQIKGLLSGVPEVVTKFKAQSISSEVLAQSKGMRVTEFKTQTELPSDRLFLRMNLELFGLDSGSVNKYLNWLEITTPTDVMKFAKQKLNLGKGHLYIMGDKEKLMPILKEAKLDTDAMPIVEVTDIP